MKKNLFIVPIALIGLLSSCGGSPASYKAKIISPVGAPTLAFYDSLKDSNFDTNSTPSNVLAQLQGNTYDVVVFDSINGLRSIKKNSSEFKLLRVITGGNYYIAGINKEATDVPTADDVIVSFGQGLIPDMVYNYLFPEVPVDYYVSGASDAAAVLTSGLYSGNPVDYVFMAEPSLYATINNKNADTYGHVTSNINVRQAFKEKSSLDAIPQAGVFVRNSAYEGNLDYYKDFLSLLNDRIDTVISDPDTAKIVMDQSGSLDEQKTKMGFNSNIMYALQKDEQNRFGMVDADEYKTLNINTFLTTIGSPEIDENLIIK